MLAPSNVWLNFSSCIVSGASGVKVPPAIKGSPFFRYCGCRIVGGRSRRNVKRSVAKNAHTFSQRFLASIIIKDGTKRSIQRKLFPFTSMHINAVQCCIEKSQNTFAYDHFTPRYCYILTVGQQVARSRLGPFMSSFKNLSIRGEDPRLNFMR